MSKNKGLEKKRDKFLEKKWDDFWNKIYKEVDFSVNDYISMGDNKRTYDEIIDALNYDGSLDQEVIYHAVALKYLMKNDPSLQISLGLAGDMGFTCDNLHAEALASILKTDILKDELDEREDEINEFLEEFYELYDEEYSENPKEW